MKLTIRRIEGRDIGALREMSVAFMAELNIEYPIIDEAEIDKHMLQILSMKDNLDGLYFVAYDGKKPAGFLLGYVGNKPYSRPERVAVAEELYVVPAKRGGPVGLKLMQAAGKWALDRGAEAFECVGGAGTTDKRWEKFGFKPHTVYGHMDPDAFLKLVGRFVGE